MSTDQAVLSHHPAPHRDRVSPWSAAFGVVGGPLAWFIELCAGYALATIPCAPPNTGHAPHAVLTTWPALVALMIACVVVALLAFLAAYRDFARTRREFPGDQDALMDIGHGRTRFLALWGMLYGAGFAIVAALTAVAFAILPHCTG